MKKILIDVDEKCFPRDSPLLKILDSLLEINLFKQKIAVVVYQIEVGSFYECKKINGIDSYIKRNIYLRTTNKNNFLKRYIISFINKFLKYINLSKRKKSQFDLYKNIYKAFKFDEIIKITYRLKENEDLVSFKKHFNIPYSVIMLDPVSVSPTILKDVKLVREAEEELISNAHIYYVPQGWLQKYKAAYRFSNIHEFFFPLINKQISSKQICCNSNSITFLHLGNMYEDREHYLAADYFTSREAKLDVFGSIFSSCTEKCFVKKKRVEDVHNLMCSYNFMVLLDNIGDNINFIPSKLIDYINSGKPIIVFGKGNNNTELLLRDYPIFFYCKSKDDFDGLDLFIKEKNGMSIDSRIIHKNYFKNTNEFMAKDIIEKINQ